MGIGGFGTGPASKFATDKRAKLPIGSSRCFTEDFLYWGAASYPVG
jgi:hypothetical protein